MNRKPDIIYGIRTVIEAMKAGQHLERVFIQKNLKDDSYHELMSGLRQSSVPMSKVPIERINKFTHKSHQGVIALISPIQYHTLAFLIPRIFEQGKNPLVLILDEITDVRNFGAIARTAECLGVDGIVIPVRGGAQVNRDAIKTSTGALDYIPICREKNLFDVCRYLQDSGCNIVACSGKSGHHLKKIDLTVPTAIIMGSEEKGISLQLSEIANDTVKIRMDGAIESLNVSVAAGIVLYEVQRQRG